MCSGRDSTQCPPERDRVIRRQQRYFDCPPRQTSEDRTPAHFSKFSTKSLFRNTLPITLLDGILCGHGPLVSILWRKKRGGGGIPRFSEVSCQLSVVYGQLSVAGCQSSVVSGQLSIVRLSRGFFPVPNCGSFDCASARRAKEARRKNQADAPLRMTATERFEVTTNAPPEVTVAESFALTADAPLKMTVGEGSSESAKLCPFNLAKTAWRKANRECRIANSGHFRPGVSSYAG